MSGAIFRFATVVAIFFSLFLPRRGEAAACLGDSAIYRRMKDEIGTFNAASRTTVLLPCDTMVVEAGKMTTIYPNTLLHFGSKVNEACVIIVRGQLFAEGSRTGTILFAGNVQASEMGVVSGRGRWGGFLIDTLGSVYFRDVEVKHAATGMIFIGRNSRIERTSFVGSYGLILPGGRNFSLDPKGQYFPVFDILNPPKVPAPAAESTASPAAPAPRVLAGANGPTPKKGESGRKSSAWIWSSLAAGTLLAGGAVTYVLWDRSSRGGDDGGSGPSTQTPTPNVLQPVSEIPAPGRSPRP